MVIAGEAEMYKLFLLDYSMPEMDGPQVAIEIRKILQEQDISQPMICCCTAYDDISYQKKAYEAGMNNFVIKPVSM